jgi:signal peptidase I
MEPTLQIGDRMLTYQGIYDITSPERGDIITFSLPPEALHGTGPDADIMISRIVGLPGETLEVSSGKVLINETPLEEPYTKALPEYTLEPLLIPSESYIVLSDNRNNAFDGHAWGLLPEQNIIGKVQSIYWPPGRYGSVY